MADVTADVRESGAADKFPIKGVQVIDLVMYASGMDIAISELRSNLREWVDRARAGDDVVVTERGIPVARLVGVDSASVVERLERDGVLSHPERVKRPRASGRTRVPAAGSVSDLIAELRR